MFSTAPRMLPSLPVGYRRGVNEQEPQHEVGVGPWEGPWPEGDHFDPELLEHGDRRNVADHFRYWSLEAIKADLDTRRHGFHVAIENWQHDINIGSIVRTANAFNAAGVHVVGRKRWNRRGAMVTDRYLHIFHHETVAEFVGWASERALPVVAVDTLPDAVPVESRPLPASCILLFGQEGPGLSAEAVAAADSAVVIRQFGSTRSLNAAAAASIVMHEWVRVHAPSV